jgi:hypothetical protein
MYAFQDPVLYPIVTHSCQVADVYKNKFLESWGAISKLRKPVIAAVSGFAVRIHVFHCTETID